MVANVSIGKIVSGGLGVLGKTIKSVSSQTEIGNSRVSENRTGLGAYSLPGVNKQVSEDSGETANEGNTKNQVDTKKEAEDKKKELANTASSAVKSFDKATKPSDQADQKVNPDSKQESALKPGDISKQVSDAVKQNQNSGNNSGSNSDQGQNRFVSKDPITTKDPSQVDSQQGGRFANANDGLSDGSRFEQVAGKQFSSDPETAGKNFGLAGPGKDSAGGSSSQQQAPIAPIQGSGGFGGVGGGPGGINNSFNNINSNNSNSFNNGQTAINGDINNGGSQQINQNIEQPGSLSNQDVNNTDNSTTQVGAFRNENTDSGNL